MAENKKVALVTGSTSGIGLACAHVLAKRGIDVIVTGSRPADSVQELLEGIRRHGVQVDYVSADLSQLPDIEKLWSEVIRLHPDGVDILINNAGLQHSDLVINYPDEKWDLLMAVMLTAPFRLTKRCLPGMKNKGWGRIVNMSSVLGVVSMPFGAVYSAAKHGLVGLTKGVALEHAKQGITCNAVCPAYVATEFTQRFIDSTAEKGSITAEEVAKQFILPLMPTGQMITSEQVAELVEFLCLSSASSQVTGSVYLIDAGFSAK